MILPRIGVKFYTIYSKLILKLSYGKNIKLGKKFKCRPHISFWIVDGNVEIGDDVFFNSGCSINCVKRIKIGSDCIFGENVKIYDHNHKFKDRDLVVNKQGLSTEDIIIGKNCWIGSNVLILKGARIGDNCVVGAGCIINKYIQDNTIVRCNSNIIEESRR